MGYRQALRGAGRVILWGSAITLWVLAAVCCIVDASPFDNWSVTRHGVSWARSGDQVAPEVRQVGQWPPK